MHFKVYSKYYYSKLDNISKKVYDKILNAWLNYEEKITLPILYDSIDYDIIFKYINYDNPELFYVNFKDLSVIYSHFVSVVSMKMLYTVRQCEQIKIHIAKLIDNIKILCNNSKFDSEKTVHDFIIQNVSYSSNLYSVEAHNINGALINGSAVCEGYAKTFKLLCDAIHIPCIFVSGLATDSNGYTENHAWNIVRKNKKNYHVDVTWNCGIDSYDIPLYYNVPDLYISKNHSWQQDLLPICSDFSEINKILTYVMDKKSLANILANKSYNKEKVFAVIFNKKFDSAADIINIISDIVCLKKIRISSFSVSYHSSIDCAIIEFNY